jgi:murein tripeptide amidase MpaA
MKNITKGIFLIFMVFTSTTLCGQSSEWKTYYEKSGYKRTPSYEKTIEYSKKLAENSKQLEYKTFGKSARGKDLPLIIFDKDSEFTPEKAKENNKLVLLVEACIHPGESEGKDAGLMLLRDIVIKNKYKDALDGITLLFIPVFNVDGHERFGPFNRINQNGPEEMGWRTTAQNLNLNRDFLKADAPEMKDWLKLFNKWLPDFFIDSHTTDGADYQYVITYALETFGNMDKGLTDWQKQIYLPKLKVKMKNDSIPFFRYISFKDWHDPTSGMVSWAASPRLSEGYTAIQNRPGLLIETHMLKPYKERVEGTYHTILNTIQILSDQKQKLKRLNEEADKYCASEKFRKKPFPVDFEAGNDSTMMDFKGINYKITESSLTGNNWIQYTGEKKNYKLPYYNDVKVTEVVNIPEMYIIPPEWHSVISRLKCHGIKYFRTKKKLEINITSYKFKDVKWASQPYEGRHRIVDFKTDTIEEKRQFPEKSVIIPTNQRTARVIAHIFEPNAPDSYLKWGFFNAIFEQKEYAEMYVMEKMARKMLKDNPKLKKEFERKMENKEFSENPWRITNWFYKQTPYWDERKNRYPVGKINKKEAIELGIIKK